MLAALLATSLLVATPPALTPADPPAGRPPTGPDAWVKIATTSTQPASGTQIRQRASDGHDETSYQSAGPARTNDHLTLTFDGPAEVRGLRVVTGLPDGTAALAAGAIEVAEDGTTFAPVATCDAQGAAQVDFAARRLQAVRVRATRDHDHPLVVREIRIDSDRVRPFQHPVAFAVDCRDAPEMQAWTETSARLCEQWYDTLNDVTTLADTHPTDAITLIMRRDYQGAAEAANRRITASVRFFTDRPADRGALIHETIHVIQNYPSFGSRRAPVWLVEGIDDYIRFFIYEPGQAGPIPRREARFDGSYRITATFLDFVVRTHDRQLIPHLDQALRTGKYTPEVFRDRTGRTLAELNDEWRISLGLPAVAQRSGEVGPISREPGTPTGRIEGPERGKAFRDEARGRLCRLVVGAGSWIDSVACVWTDGRTEINGSTHGGDGGEEQTVELEPGESLVQVSGVIRDDGDRGIRIGQEVVGSLTLRTTKRTLRRLGDTTKGRRFTLQAPPGQEICGFQGRTGQWLNAIGLVCRPIPTPASAPASAPTPAPAPAPTPEPTPKPTSP